MSRNGAGTYTLPEAPFVFDTVISETAMNSNLSNIAAALTASIANDGQTPILANLPMSGFKHTGVSAASGTNAGEYLARDYYAALRYLNNVLVNPSGEINQRGTTSTADDTYGGPDRWYSLNQTGATSWAQGTFLEDGTPFYQRGTQSQASAQRFGRAQIVENANCSFMRGQSIVLSARVQLSASATLRYAILEWTGTSNSPTSDVVNDWTSSTYTAGNFFISTTTNVLAVGSVALTANTPATITALTATVGSSMNNLIVFFWTEATAAQNVTLDISKASLKLGSVATPFYPRPFPEELLLCRRYYHKLTSPSSGSPVASGSVQTTTLGQFPFTLVPSMRDTPDLSVSAVGDFQIAAANVNTDTTNLTLSGSSNSEVVRLIATVSSGLTAGHGAELTFDATAGAFVAFAKEL
jgi:hypothetical protein